MLKVYIILFLTVLFFGCANPPDFTDEPTIEFEGWSKNTMIQGNLNEDSLTVRLSFTDGDGDLGYPEDDPTRDVFIIDTRTGNVQDRLKMPEIPIDGTGNGINGSINLRIFNTCCLFPRNIPPCTITNMIPIDSLQYDIYIVDRAGNQSNTIKTPMLYLKCN